MQNVMQRVLILLVLVGLPVAGFAQDPKPEAAKPPATPAGTAQSGTAQSETAQPPAAGAHSVVPKPLEDDFLTWMIGEWEGATTSSLGKTHDVQKVEWDLDNQFVVIHYTSKTTEMTPEQIGAMANAYQISKEDAEKMKDLVAKGMGILTVDPTSKEIYGFWFDNLRSISEGSGRREANKLVMEWENEEGHSKYVMDKAGDDKMVIVSTIEAPNGELIQSRTELTRKK